METTDTDTETTQNNGTPTLPSPDFSTLQSAATTYRMLGATPVPLSYGLPREGNLIPDRYLFGVTDPRTVPEEEPDWQEADGIGIVTGAERWYALVLPSFHVQPVVEGLGIENTNWIAQNGQVVTIYFRTDASRGTLRTLSLALDEAVDPKVLPAMGVECYGPPIWSVAIPVPPSGKLTYGEWEFWRDAPEEPPPFRSFQVQAKSLAGSHVQKSNEHGDESKVSMELGTSSHVAGREVEAEAGQPGSNLPL